MPANIEIKALVSDFEALRHKAEKISDSPVQVIPQEDTFFSCPHGRLKLRELGPACGQLVYYLRQDMAGPKHSEYQISNTTDPAGLKQILAQAFGVLGVVTKVRYLYLAGQTRIHLDDVQGLGKFVELEVVLQPGQSDAEGQAIADDLMSKLGIQEADLIEGAYMDLIRK
ncbi:MAG: adenylate cyclase [Anaerolineales bacterium]|nr:class IV adenylate cyclase [Anaerolineae bacterium]PWB54619.1 MAG: adenylate cyclase [Anaerolineales bacterium]